MSDTNEWKEVYVYSDTTQRALGHFSDSSRKHHHNVQSSSRSSSLPSFEIPSENSTPKVFVERTSSQILLNLPSVMIEDEGTYKCDVTYEKGSSCPSLSYIKLFVTGTTFDFVLFCPFPSSPCFSEPECRNYSRVQTVQFNLSKNSIQLECLYFSRYFECLYFSRYFECLYFSRYFECLFFSSIQVSPFNLCHFYFFPAQVNILLAQLY